MGYCFTGCFAFNSIVIVYSHTNVAPHEQFLGFDRRSMLGISTPSLLSCPGPVLLKRRVRSSKYDPHVDEVELIHATPSYACVRMQSGRKALCL